MDILALVNAILLSCSLNSGSCTLQDTTTSTDLTQHITIGICEDTKPLSPSFSIGLILVDNPEDRVILDINPVHCTTL